MVQKLYCLLSDLFGSYKTTFCYSDIVVKKSFPLGSRDKFEILRDTYGNKSFKVLERNKDISILTYDIIQMNAKNVLF